jgi:hypothetical protein
MTIKISDEHVFKKAILTAAVFIGSFLTTLQGAEPNGYREVVEGGVKIFGLDPAWATGREFEKAFDNDPSTFYDYESGDVESFTGFDNGEAAIPEVIYFTPRTDFTSRMLGGRFEGSNESPYSGYVTIYEINVEPSESGEVISIETESAYRYIRYLAPVGSHGNIAEFSVDFRTLTVGTSSTGESGSLTEGPESSLTVTQSDGNSVESTSTDQISTSALTDRGGRLIRAILQFFSRMVVGGSVGQIAEVEPIAGQGGVKISFNLNEAGQTSAAVYDAAGRLIRTLLQGEELDSGEHEVIWDGLDRNGNASSIGEYTFKILQAEGTKAEFLTNLGVNPGSSPYDMWIGTDGGATAVAADTSGMYLVAQNSETAPTLLKQSHDGSQRIWTQEHYGITVGEWQGGISLESDQNGRLYMLQQNGYLQVLDTETGELISSWDVLPAGVDRVTFNYRHEIGEIAKADIAAYGSTVVVSYYVNDRIVWLNAGDGSILATVSVSKPTGLAVSPQGEVYAISGSRVIKVAPSGSITTVVESGLQMPQRIAYDGSSHTLLVSDGALGAQVKRFSINGNLLSTYGASGGRQFGAYINTNFYGITDLATDGFGGFIVAEPRTPPRRVAHFDANGSLLDEWFGGQDYYAYAEPDPRDPSKAWLFTGEGLALVSLDLVTGDWDVLETWVPKGMAGGLVEHLHGFEGQWQVVYSGEQRYLISQGNPRVFAHSDGDLRAVSISSRNAEKLNRARQITGGAPGWARSFTWSDGNGDGLPQSAEITYSGSLDVPSASKINDDFTLVGFERLEDALQINKTEAKWGTYGPYYPIGKENGALVPVAATETSRGVESRGTGAYQDEAGAYYGFYNIEKERHGVYWPTDWSSISRFVKMDEAGNELWSVGRHAYHGGLAGTHDTTYIPTPKGQFHVLAKVIGELEDAVVLADRVENPGMIWTKDGLFAGTLFDRRADDGLPDSVYSWHLTDASEAAITTSDNASGGKLIRYADGTVLWFTQGRNSVPVYKVTGWDDWKRQERQFQLNTVPVVAEANGTGLSAQYFYGALTEAPVANRVETQVWHGLAGGVQGNDAVIDGYHGAVYDWTSGSDVLNKQTNYSVRWVGELEAPLSEEFTFSIYARGGARLWIDGKQIIHSWNEVTPRVESFPVRLVAGKRYAIQLDYTTSQDQPAVSLNWESPSFDRERIPTRFLSPVLNAPIQTQLRKATDYIDAPSFDIDSGHMQDWLTDEFSVLGERQWGFGATGSYMGYQAVDFAEGVSTLHIQAGGAPSGENLTYPVKIAFRLDGPNGPTIAEVILKREVQTIQIPTIHVTGVHDVYAVNTTTTEWHYMDFRWFRFE